MQKNTVKKNEALLWFGKWTSKFGNIIFDYANSISIVGAFSSSPWVLALYQSSETIIQIIFNLIGGAKADSSNRKNLLIVTDILAAFICVGLSLFIGTSFMAAVMVAANTLLAVVYAFNSPTYKSIIREVIERERIGFFNSISHAGSELIRVAGPVVGVGLVGVIGTRGALLFDAGTFLISALAECMLTKVNVSAEAAKESKSVLSDIVEGFAYLLKEKNVLFLVVLSSLVNFFLAGYNLLLPYTDRMFIDGFYSKALIMEAIGGIISSAGCSRIINRFRDNINALILFLFSTGLVLALEPIFALAGNVYLCLIPYLLFGLSLTAFNIQFMSYVQIAVNEAYLGRVFSIIFTVAVLFMPFGSLMFSMLIDTGNISSFYTVGGGIAVLAVAGMMVQKWLKCRIS